MPKKSVNSIIVALFLTAHTITMFLPVPGLLFFSIFLLTVLFLFNGNQLYSKNVAPLFVFCLFFFVISFFIIGTHDELVTYFFSFLVMGGMGLSMSQCDFSESLVIKTLCIISPLVLIMVMRNDYSDDSNYVLRMGVSFIVQKYLISLLFFAFFLKNTSIWYRTVAFLFFAVFLFFVLPFSSRGPLLGVFVFLVLGLLIMSKRSLKVKLLISLVLPLFIVVNFDAILEMIGGFLDIDGLDIKAIDKLMELNEKGDLSNGREYIVEKCYELLYSSPLWGNGIAIVDKISGGGYPHNIFLQLLVEGGLLLCLPFVLIIFRAFVIVYNNRYGKEQRYFVAYLICTGFIGLLFSDYLWRVQTFWFLIGYVISLKSYKYANSLHS